MSRAHQLMREHSFRHLPVIDNGKLVGILSDRDLHLLVTRNGANPEVVTVEEAMTKCVVAVAPETPLDEAIELMISARCGSLVVMGKRGVSGILTSTDALSALIDLLRREAA